MKTIDLLLEATKDIWDQYYTHPFVSGIGKGTLDKEKFRKYIIQDYLYLIDYARVYAIGLAKGKSPKSRKKFADSVNMLTSFEMNIHDGYMGVFNVSQEEVSNTKMDIDNLSYTSYMLRIAYEEGEAEIVAAVLSCAYSYEVIAKKLIEMYPGCENHPFYGDWIKGYASEEYHNGNIPLLELLEELTKDYTPKKLKYITEIFVVCSQYELMFWNMAFER